MLSLEYLYTVYWLVFRIDPCNDAMEWLSPLLPDAWRFAGMAVLVLGCACLQGVGGIGFAMVSAPIGALLFPELVPGPLILLAGVLSALSVWRERKSVVWRLLPSAVVGRAVGTLAAAVLLNGLDAHLVDVVFAVLILGGVALSLSRWNIPSTPATWACAGIMSGVMGTLTSAGAPPLALVAQRLNPAAIRATLSVIFLVGTAMALATLVVLQRFSWAQLALALALLPFMGVGFVLSTPLAAHCSRATMRHLLLGLTAASAGVLLIYSLR